MKPTIDVEVRPTSDGWVADVALGEPPGRHRYEVRVARPAWESLTGGEAPVEALVEASFRFLLEREPPDAILQRFDLLVIERYFPEYREAMRAWMARPASDG